MSQASYNANTNQSYAILYMEYLYDKVYFSSMVHMGFYHSKLCRVPLNCVAWPQNVPQFGGGGYQVTMKPIEPQGQSIRKTKSIINESNWN